MASLNKLVISSYSNLRGVDFSRHSSLVDKNRSPYCLNMMPDSSTNPVKRPGWETVYSLSGRVHNIWFCTLGDTEYILCHCGDKLYSLGEETKVLYEGVSDSKGCGFYALKGETPGFYILTGREYLVFDGQTVKDVAQDAYIPLVTIAKAPSGGGESYENINMLTPKRRESFIGTSGDLIYQLGSDGIDSVDKIEVLQKDGTHLTLTAQTDYTVNLALGKITFTKAQPTVINGQDNIFVTYTKTVEGYKQNVTGCTVCAQFGLGGENRVFISGNKACPHKDFWSGVFDPSYFADLCYSVIGSGQTAVMGYLKMGDQLAVVKAGNGQDNTLFLRTAQLDDDGRAQFTIQGGISGTGAVSKHCFATVGDEPLFLSPRGVFAVAGSVLTSQKLLINRSGQVDARLTEEKQLDKAVGCVWKDFYVVSVNGNCYLLDTRYTVPAKSGEKNSGYEAYYWTNVAASCITSHNDVLWFGTADGQVRRFKDTAMGTLCYSDDGEAIHAVWRTPTDDEGRPDRFKTLMRRGCLVTLTPFENSSCDIYYSVDGQKKQFVESRKIDMSTMFGSINFARLTFNTNANPREIYFYNRRKRYKRIQLVFENSVAGEGFGIQKITKLYRLEGCSKNRR